MTTIEPKHSRGDSSPASFSGCRHGWPAFPRRLPSLRAMIHFPWKRQTGPRLLSRSVSLFGALSCLLLSACTEVMYSGPRKPISEVCTFSFIDSGKVGGGLEINFFDGRMVDSTTNDYLEFLPGEHVVTVHYQLVGPTSVATSVDSFDLRFLGVAGHMYAVRANVSSFNSEGGSWNPIVVDLGAVVDSANKR